MNRIEVTRPLPACIVPLCHPARKYVPAANTDIAETIERNRIILVCDVKRSCVSPKVEND